MEIRGGLSVITLCAFDETTAELGMTDSLDWGGIDGKVCLWGWGELLRERAPGQYGATLSVFCLQKHLH